MTCASCGTRVEVFDGYWFSGLAQLSAQSVGVRWPSFFWTVVEPVSSYWKASPDQRRVVEAYCGSACMIRRNR